MDEESVLRIRNFNPFINSCCVLRRYVVGSNFILFCSFFWLINIRTDACICHRITWPRPLLVAVWAENYNFVLESGKNIDTLDHWTYARTYVRRKVEVSKVFKILISFVRANGFLWEIKFTKKIVLTYVRRKGKMTSANNSVQFRAKLSCVRTYACQLFHSIISITQQNLICLDTYVCTYVLYNAYVPLIILSIKINVWNLCI